MEIHISDTCFYQIHISCQPAKIAAGHFGS